MCGIAGFLDPRASTSADALTATVETMAASLNHRGPDDHGSWVDGEAGIALGFRRLAIIDLSPAGHQPMVSSCGRYVLVYNGEIYNAAELRRELESAGRTFRGHCDAEVLVEACGAWGLAATLGRLLGMFAFALWDREARTLSLVRDRLGVKPLYWGEAGGVVLFGSELKALVAHGGWSPEIDRDSLATYMRHMVVPAPASIYRGIHKLEPGQVVTIDSSGASTASRYWDLRAVASDTPRADIGEADALNGLAALLNDSVGRRMVADVPLGAFLSGGIDSSLVVALMQAQSSRPVQTYTVGFTERAFDEAPEARAVAAHLGTDHTELYVEPGDALAVVPELPHCYNEPFADSSQIPTLLISRLAQRSVTVALSGDGGDEVFGGYKRHYRAHGLARRLGRLPGPLRRAVAAVWGAVPRASAHGAYRRDRAAAVIGAADDVALYRALATYVHQPDALVSGGAERHGALWDDAAASDVPNFMERAGYFDTVTSLPDQMLTKVDRASMATSLEVRVPLLDHRVVEYAWSLPPGLKFGHRADNKRLLRALLYKHVPRSLVDR
ncbi:MAG: asparagine synthase (glutamine-hydrolyzing), partial [Alphaproteobacteria bacterium]